MPLETGLPAGLLSGLLSSGARGASLDAAAWHRFRMHREQRGAPPFIAVVATPKSGSTFVSNVLARCCQLPYHPLCYAYASNEHELYPPAFLAAGATGAVSQLHMRATPHNIQLLTVTGTKGIVLSRNIYDAVVSFRNDLRAKFALGRLGTGIFGYSFVWLSEKVATLDDEALLDYCLDFYLPWYANFLLSWERQQSRPYLCFVRYETLMRDKADTLESILAFLSMGGSLKRDLLDRDFIAGKSGLSGTQSAPGSGMQALSDRQRARIETFIKRFDSAFLEAHLSADPSSSARAS